MWNTSQPKGDLNRFESTASRVELYKLQGRQECLPYVATLLPHHPPCCQAAKYIRGVYPATRVYDTITAHSEQSLCFKSYAQEQQFLLPLTENTKVSTTIPRPPLLCGTIFDRTSFPGCQKTRHNAAHGSPTFSSMLILHFPPWSHHSFASTYIYIPHTWK